MYFLKFASTERYLEGIISSIEEEAVIIDLKFARSNKIAKKSVISEDEIKEGQVVGFLASFPEVVFDGVDDKHLSESKKKIRAILENALMHKAAS